MRRLGLEREVVDQAVYASSVQRFREAGIVMPTFAQLADPLSMPAEVTPMMRVPGGDTRRWITALLLLGTPLSSSSR